MNTSRISPTCTVFEGKIIVTGGRNNYHELKSVESYDYYKNKWIYLPDMINGRINHAAVSMGNKMFVIGGRITTICEVFDSFSRKFTLIESVFPRLSLTFLNFISKATCIGNSIIVICEKYTHYYKDTCLYTYKVCKKQWSQNNCYILKNMFDLSCVKYYTD